MPVPTARRARAGSRFLPSIMSAKFQAFVVVTRRSRRMKACHEGMVHTYSAHAGRWRGWLIGGGAAGRGRAKRAADAYALLRGAAEEMPLLPAVRARATHERYRDIRDIMVHGDICRRCSRGSGAAEERYLNWGRPEKAAAREKRAPTSRMSAAARKGFLLLLAEKCARRKAVAHGARAREKNIHRDAHSSDNIHDDSYGFS